MNIKLRTDSLREFQKRATQIQTNTLLPILTNLKLSYSEDICTLTKNNIGAVIVGQVEATGDACNIFPITGVGVSDLPDTAEINEVIDTIEDMLFEDATKEAIQEYLSETITTENIYEFI